MAAGPSLLGARPGNRGARAALAYAFTTLGADHVISVIHPRNSRSIRVAEKIGERFEREIDFDGNPTLIYGVTR